MGFPGRMAIRIVRVRRVLIEMVVRRGKRVRKWRKRVRVARARLARRAVRERVELMGFSDAMMTQRRVAKGKVEFMALAG